MMKELLYNIVMNMDRETFMSLKFHTPYNKRKATVLSCLKRFKTGVPVDIPQVGGVTVPLDVLSKIISSASTKAAEYGIPNAILCGAEFLAFAASFYNMVRALHRGSMIDKFVSVSGFLASLLCVGRLMHSTLSYDVTTETLKVYRMLFKADVDIPQSGEYSGVASTVKMVSIILCTACSLIMKDASKIIGKLSGAIALSANLNTIIQDLVLDIFGVDISNMSRVRKVADDLTTEGHGYMKLTCQHFVGDNLLKAEAWIRNCDTLLRSVKNTNFNTATLVAVHAAVSKRIADTRQLLNECRTRPAPAAVYFYGEHGHGKTDFMKSYLVPALNRAFGISGNAAQIYDLNTGKYNRVRTGERWAVYDEFAAKAHPDNEAISPTQLNSIISGGMATMPGASLESKHQTAAFNAVFLSANKHLADVDVGFSPEARKAFSSRFRILKVHDPQYKPTSTGATRTTGQNHRVPDFSHLDFLWYTDSPTCPVKATRIQGGYSLKAAEVVNLVIYDIQHAQRAFEATKEVTIPNVDPGFELWTDLPLDVPQVSTPTPVVWISGPPGVGKTKTVSPIVQSVVSSLGYKIATLFGPRNARHGCAYILDDIVDPSTREGQRAFSQFVDGCNVRDVIIVISNYGRHKRLSNGYGYFSDILDIPALEPSFRRRAGIGGPLHYETFGSGLVGSDGRTVSNAEFASILAKNLTSLDVEIVREPPQAGLKYDIDVSLPEHPSLSDLGSALAKSNCSPSQVASLSLKLKDMVGSNRMDCMSLEEIARDVVRRVILDYPDLTARVFTPRGVFCYVNRTLHIYERIPASVSYNDDSFIVEFKGDKYYISVTEFHSFLEGKVDTISENYPVLVSLGLDDPVAWTQLIERYPVGIRLALKEVNDIVSSAFGRVFKAVCDNPLLIILFILAAVIVYFLFAPSEPKCMCKYIPWDDECPFDGDEEQAKGKTKGGRGRKSKFCHFKAIRLNGRVIYADDNEGDQFTERIWHELSMRARDGGHVHDWKVGDVHFKATYDDLSMRWAVDTHDVAQAALRGSPLFSKLKGNVRKIVAANGATMYTTFLTPTLAVVPKHWTASPGPWQLAGSCEELVRLYVDSGREVMFLTTTHGRQVSGVCDLNNYIVPLDVVRSVSQSTFMISRADGTDLCTGEYVFQERPSSAFTADMLQHWGVNVGLMAWGEYASFSSAGDCGSPIIGHIDDAYYLIGIHAALRPAQRKWASVVLCKELIAEALADKVQNSEPTAPISCMSPAADCDVVFPRPLLEMQTKPPPGRYHPTGAVKDIMFFKNFKPMDSRNDRYEYSSFPLTVTGFDVKRPALSEVEIYKKHGERIPEDACGLKHVHLIRTKRLEENYYSTSAFQEYESVAATMASYYKIFLGKESFNPMSIEAAVFGNYQSLPLDTTTSAGVTIRLLCGVTMKNDLINKDLQTIDPRLQDLITTQYSLAKQGVRYTFPADANLKAETLPLEKVWKKRVFYNVPIPTVINLKRILAPLQHAFTSHGVASPFLFSMYPLRDWDELAASLLEHSGIVCCVDVSSYDHGLPGHILRVVGEFVVSLYGTNNRPHLAQTIRTLFEEVICMPLIFGDVIVSKEGGLPSGVWGTSILDAVAWEVMLFICWRHIAENDSFSLFKDSVNAKYVGDDLIFSVKHEYKDIFNAETVAIAMGKLFSLKVTPASNKDGSIVPYTSLEEASFCSRKFVRLEGHPSVWIPQLKSASLYSQLCYSRYVQPADLYEQYVQARFDIMAYGRDRYDVFEGELALFARKHNIAHSIMTYEDALEEAWQVVTSPNQRTERVFDAIIVSDQRQKPTKMSSTLVKRMKKEIRDSWQESATLQDFLQNAPHTNKLKALIETDLVAFEDYQVWTRPVSGETLKGIKSNSLAGYAAVKGLLPFKNRTDLEGWKHVLPSELNTRKALTFNNALKAHQSLAYWYDNPTMSVPMENIAWFISLPEVAQMNANLPETSAPAEEKKAMLVGSAAMGQLDPLMAPQMTATPAVATTSQEITDSDGAVIPNIIDTMGGLGPIGLANTNYADNVVSLCNKQIYVRRYNLTSNTAAGTIIDEMNFDPWDETVVSRPIAQYGSLHQVFNGSLDFVLNSYSAATIVGSVIVTYVPPLLQENFVPSLENLKTLPSTVINLKEGGSSKITATGGNLTDCAVVRARLESGTAFYGKIIVAAYTDIVNAYGVAVSIPVVRTCALGPDAYFSHPQYLLGSTGLPTLNPGPTPPLATDLVLDGETLYPMARVPENIPYYQLEAVTGGFKAAPFFQTDSWTWRFSDTDTRANTGSKLSLWWGANPWGNNYPSIASRTTSNSKNSFGSLKLAQVDVADATIQAEGPLNWNGSLSTDTFVYSGVILNNNEAPTVSMKVTENPFGTGYNIASQAASLVPFNFTSSWYDGSPKVNGTFEPLAYYKAISTLEAETDTRPGEVGDDGETYLAANAAADVNPPVRVTYTAAGAPVCSKGWTTAQPPTGYIQLIFERDPAFIPAVNASLAESTVTYPYGAVHNVFMETVRIWFARSGVSSYSYDLRTSAGEILGTMLVNTQGAFMYSSVAADKYLLLTNAVSYEFGNYQTYSTEFPIIQELAVDQFTSRVVTARQTWTAKMAGKEFLKLGDNSSSREVYTSLLTRLNALEAIAAPPKEEQAQMATMAMMGAMKGASEGLGTALGWRHERRMQERYLQMQKTMAAMQFKAAAMRYGYNGAVTMEGNQYSHGSYSPATSTRSQYDVGTMAVPTMDSSTQVNIKPRRRQAPQPPARVEHVSESVQTAGPSDVAVNVVPPSAGDTTTVAQVHSMTPMATGVKPAGRG